MNIRREWPGILLTILVGVVLLLTLNRCKKSPVEEPEVLRKTATETHHDRFMDRVDHRDSLAHALLTTYPDSAVFLTRENIRILDSANELTKLFTVQVFLSEIYLYWLYDEYLAMYWYSQAIQTMDKIPGVELSNPFFLIDLGNLLYLLKLYDQALNFYKSAEEIAILKNDSYAVAVALNNQGLCHQESGNLEGASDAFRAGLTIRRQLMPVLAAQNLFYIARLLFMANAADSTEHYIRSALSELDRQDFSGKNIRNMTVDDALHLRAEVFSQLYLLKAKNNPEDLGKAVEHLQRSANCVDSNNIAKLKPEIYLMLAGFLAADNDHEKALVYANGALQAAIQTRRFQKASEIAVFMAEKLATNITKKNKYLQISLSWADSLIHIENSSVTLSNKLLLITSHLQRKVYEYQLQQVQTIERIHFQQTVIVSLIFFLMVLSIVFLVAMRQRHLKLVAYRRIIEQWSMQQERNGILDQKSPDLPTIGGIPMAEKLEILMEQERVFVQPGLTLEKLSMLVGTNSTYLSQCINHHMHCNFNDYINRFRVREAYQIMQSRDGKDFSLDQLFLKVGFTSRSAFYNAFKKFTGLTPSWFIKNLPVTGTLRNTGSMKVGDHQTTT